MTRPPDPYPRDGLKRPMFQDTLELGQASIQDIGTFRDFDAKFAQPTAFAPGHSSCSTSD